MATVQITVPINGSREVRTNWECSVSTYTDSGDDVEFVDESGNACNVPILILGAGTEGTVIRKTVTGEIVSVYLVAGGPIQMWTHKILGTTDNSLSLIARLV